MYNLITDNSKTRFSKDTFIKRNKNIYEGIETENLNFEIEKVEKTGKNLVIVTYKNSMDTMSGHIEFSNEVWIGETERFYRK